MMIPTVLYTLWLSIRNILQQSNLHEQSEPGVRYNSILALLFDQNSDRGAAAVLFLIFAVFVKRKFNQPSLRTLL